MPERCRRSALGIERINTVVFGGHINDIVLSLTGNLQSRQVQRLSIDITIDSQGEEPAELSAIDIAWRELALLEICSRA